MVTVKIRLEVVDTEGEKNHIQELELKNVCLVGMHTGEEKGSVIAVMGGFSIMDFLILNDQWDEEVRPQLSIHQDPKSERLKSVLDDLFK